MRFPCQNLLKSLISAQSPGNSASRLIGVESMNLIKTRSQPQFKFVCSAFILILFFLKAAHGFGPDLSTPYFELENGLIPLETQPLFVDLKDLERYGNPEELPTLTAKSILKHLETYREEWLQLLGAKPSSSLHGLYFSSPPTSIGGDLFSATLKFLVEPMDEVPFFQTLQATLQGDPIETRFTLVELSPLERLSLEQTDFQIQVGLLDRKIIISDLKHDLKMIYPIGVGAIDQGVRSRSFKLETPLFSDPSLERKWVISKRTKPEYFKGKPFLRISEKGEYTAVGFHIQQNRELIRGFLSHGCIRMREKDLAELHSLIKKGRQLEIPIEMAYELDDSDNHPYPLENRFYNRVKNFGTKTVPKVKRGEDGLIILEQIWKTPPIESLLKSLKSLPLLN